MRKSVFVVLASCFVLGAQTPHPPRHVFSPDGRLSPPSSQPARAIAAGYLRSVAPEYNVTFEDLANLHLVKEYRTSHNGVTHLVYRPSYQDIDVYNVEWTLNIDRDGAIINSGGSLVPAPPPSRVPPLFPSALRAVRAAAGAVNPRIAERFAPFPTAAADPATRKLARFAADGFGREIEAQPVWYAVNGTPVPAWLFYIQDDDGVSNYEVVIDDATQAVLTKNSLTWFDSPRGMVFDHSSPQPNPTPGILLHFTPDLIQRTMQPLMGDPTASPAGWVSGTETAGNNVIAGLNRLGTSFAPPQTSNAADGDFTFPLELGPGAPNPTSFPDAANVNLFYWINRAHDWFYTLGFDEPAGNYQQDNFGRGGVDGDPILVYTQYGAAAPGSAALNNAFYSSQRTGEDGAPSMIGTYLDINRATGTFVDTAFDPEVVVHEYTHGVSTRLIRQFGSAQGGAMGEAFSDFFGLELTLPADVPVDGSYTQGAYFAQNFSAGTRTHPYSTSLTVNPLDFAGLGRVIGYPEVHADGEIWVEALWEVRAAYIRQFGDQEGRRRVRLLLIDAMKLSPPAPSMLDMRDSILLADNVDFGGASQDQIWQAFARRGFGVLAMASSASAIHIAASNDAPSGAPALRLYDESITIGEPLRLMAYLPNRAQGTVKVRVTTTYGDSEDVYLDRRGFTYTTSISTTESFTTVRANDGVLELVPGDTITAVLSGGLEPVQAAATARLKYFMSTDPPGFDFQNEKALSLRGAGSISLQALPFPFPFYDQSFSSVYVRSNGALTFTGPFSISCADTLDLQQHAGIAPLWMTSVTTAGSAQPGEDVYRSASADSITFRFAGEVLSGTSGQREPLNYATTLFKDGRIEFRYGSGNQNLFSTSCGSFPVVGLANGHETYYQVSTLNARTDLSTAPTITSYPPFGAESPPKGAIESPEPGVHVQSRLVVSGIRYDDSVPVARVDLLIDGVSVNHGPATVRREDVCSAQAVNGCPNIGYSFSITPASLGLAAGDHAAQIRVTNARGASTNIPDAPVPFTIDSSQPAPPTGVIETPSEGASITGTTTVKGYVYSGDLRVVSLDLLIDGITYGVPSYNQNRADICAGLSGTPPNCPNIGFTYSLNPKSASMPLSLGSHTLAIRARDELGNYTSIPETPIGIIVK